MATQEASNDERDHTPRTFTCGVFLVCQDHRVKLKGVFVEKDSKVRVANARNELIGDARNMITGFLNNNRAWNFPQADAMILVGSCAPGLDSTEELRDGIDDAMRPL